MKFGDILRELLDERKISQRKFAEKFNIATSTLGNYINDSTEPDYDMLKKFATFFGVSIDYLLDYRVGANPDHQEDHLIEIYRSLPEEYREIFIALGKALMDQSNEQK